MHKQFPTLEFTRVIVKGTDGQVLAVSTRANMKLLCWSL